MNFAVNILSDDEIKDIGKKIEDIYTKDSFNLDKIEDQVKTPELEKERYKLIRSGAEAIAKLLPNVAKFNTTWYKKDSNTNRDWLQIIEHKTDDFNLGDMGLLYSFQGGFKEPRRVKDCTFSTDLKMVYFCEDLELCNNATPNKTNDVLWVVYNVGTLKVLKINSWRHEFLSLFTKEHIRYQYMEAVITMYLRIHGFNGWQAIAKMDQNIVSANDVGPQLEDGKYTMHNYSGTKVEKKYHYEYAFNRCEFFEKFEFVARYWNIDKYLFPKKVDDGTMNGLEFDEKKFIQDKQIKQKLCRVVENPHYTTDYFFRVINPDFQYLKSYGFSNVREERLPIFDNYLRRRMYFKTLLGLPVKPGDCTNEDIIKQFDDSKYDEKKLTLDDENMRWVLYHRGCESKSDTKWCSDLTTAEFAILYEIHPTPPLKYDRPYRDPTISVFLNITAVNAPAKRCFRHFRATEKQQNASTPGWSVLTKALGDGWFGGWNTWYKNRSDKNTPNEPLKDLGENNLTKETRTMTTRQTTPEKPLPPLNIYYTNTERGNGIRFHLDSLRFNTLRFEYRYEWIESQIINDGDAWFQQNARRTKENDKLWKKRFDFKWSKKFKRWIQDYALQTQLYSYLEKAVQKDKWSTIMQSWWGLDEGGLTGKSDNEYILSKALAKMFPEAAFNMDELKRAMKPNEYRVFDKDEESLLYGGMDKDGTWREGGKTYTEKFFTPKRIKTRGWVFTARVKADNKETTKLWKYLKSKTSEELKQRIMIIRQRSSTIVDDDTDTNLKPKLKF